MHVQAYVDVKLIKRPCPILVVFLRWHIFRFGMRLFNLERVLDFLYIKVLILSMFIKHNV